MVIQELEAQQLEQIIGQIKQQIDSKHAAPGREGKGEFFRRAINDIYNFLPEYMREWIEQLRGQLSPKDFLWEHTEFVRVFSQYDNPPEYEESLFDFYA